MHNPPILLINRLWMTPRNFENWIDRFTYAGHEVCAAASSLDRSNFNYYRRSRAVTDDKEFPGRSHFTLGQDGWETIADYALDWAVRQCKPNSTLESSAPAQGVGR